MPPTFEDSSPFHRVDIDLEPCEDLVLIPASGDFLESFHNGIGLHILVCKSGAYMAFDKNGIHDKKEDLLDVNGSPKQGLYLNVLSNCGVGCPSSLAHDSWIIAFDSFNRFAWTKDSYDPDSRNCFDFALEFLLTFARHYNEKNHCSINVEPFKDKISFCQRFVLPHTRKAAIYIMKHRQFKANQMVAKAKDDKQISESLIQQLGENLSVRDDENSNSN